MMWRVNFFKSSPLPFWLSFLSIRNHFFCSFEPFVNRIICATKEMVLRWLQDLGCTSPKILLCLRMYGRAWELSSPPASGGTETDSRSAPCYLITQMNLDLLISLSVTKMFTIEV